ncbi:MAG: methyltransferase domain-containing protein [Elusimicrobia bacterium]|nr:methyltransferase domain-containing protein [Candidatus Obscuribacterium magneticum]
MIDLIKKIDQPELMDSTDLPEQVMESTLKSLEVANKYFGGTEVILKFLDLWSRHWKAGETITILDVGTGGGDIPIQLARWGSARNIHLKLDAIDLIPGIVKIAKHKTAEWDNIQINESDFFEVKENGRRFDYVIASLFLHHIPSKKIVPLLKKMDRLAKRGLIISDLNRSISGYLAVTLLCTLIGNSVVRHDGPLSVRRAFHMEELAGYAKEAGLPYLKVNREPWFRISLSGEKGHAA